MGTQMTSKCGKKINAIVAHKTKTTWVIDVRSHHILASDLHLELNTVKKSIFVIHF